MHILALVSWFLKHVFVVLVHRVLQIGELQLQI